MSWTLWWCLLYFSNLGNPCSYFTNTNPVTSVIIAVVLPLFYWSCSAHLSKIGSEWACSLSFLKLSVYIREDILWIRQMSLFQKTKMLNSLWRTPWRSIRWVAGHSPKASRWYWWRPWPSNGKAGSYKTSYFLFLPLCHSKGQDEELLLLWTIKLKPLDIHHYYYIVNMIFTTNNSNEGFCSYANCIMHK